MYFKQNFHHFLFLFQPSVFLSLQMFPSKYEYKMYLQTLCSIHCLYSKCKQLKCVTSVTDLSFNAQQNKCVIVSNSCLSVDMEISC